MDKSFIQRLARVSSVLLLALSVFLICGCSTMQPHLTDSEVQALRSATTTIIYVEPSKSLYAYIRGTEDNPGIPGDNSVEMGMAFGIGTAIASEIVYEKQQKDYYAFMRLFNKYDKTVGAFGISKAAYDVARNAVSAVPWYRNADWKVLPASNDSDFYHKAVQLTDSQVVVFISPLALIRTDAEVVRVDYRINIWFKNPGNKYDVHLYDSRLVGYEEKIYPGNQVPSDQLEDAFDDLSIDQRLNDIFSNNGALFHRTMSAILATLQPRLTFYFMGISAKNTNTNHGK